MRLFVVEFVGAGGMAHYTYQMCDALAHEGADVTLITTDSYEMDSFPHGFRVEKRLKLWSTVDRTPAGKRPRGRVGRAWFKARWTARRATRGLRYVAEWWRLSDYLIAEKPDLVQFGTINFPFESLFLARLRRHGLVISQICHEWELRERSGWFFSLIERGFGSVFDQLSAIFLHGETNRRRFLSVHHSLAERVHVIAHGNQEHFRTAANPDLTEPVLRERYNLPPGRAVVLFFGVLTPSKGIPDLLDAFAEVRRQSDACLLIAGYPSKLVNVDDYVRRASDLGIADAVRFDPRYVPSDEVGPLMELSTAVVYPYRSASTSGSLQAAYTFGRPVVATAIGGLPDQVEDERSGLLVPAGNRDALAGAILRLVENPQLAGFMGRYARHLSETRSSWTTSTRVILAVYRELLAGRPAPTQADEPIQA